MQEKYVLSISFVGAVLKYIVSDKVFLPNFTLPTIIFTLSSILNIIELPHIKLPQKQMLSHKFDELQSRYM